MRWKSALIASVMFAAPSAVWAQSAVPDLSAYNCARVGDGKTALTSRHVLQYVDGQFVEWDEYLTHDATPRVACIQRTRPSAAELSAAAAKDLLTAGARVGVSAPNNTERAQSESTASTSDGKFRDDAVMPLPKAVDPAAGVERSQSFDPDAMSPASRRYDTAPQAAASPSSDSSAVQALQDAAVERSADGVERELTVGVDDRTRINTSTSQVYPYNTIGYLSVKYPNGGSFRCTGVLVSPYVVLTAGHCVHNNDRGGFITSATFYPGQNEASATSPTLRPFGGKSDIKWVRTTTRWTQISGPDSHVTSDYQYDLAAIEFATPFTHTSTFMALSFNATNSPGYNVGYPACFGANAAADDCANTSYTEGQWYSSGADISTSTQRSYGVKEYRMDATGGQSGSPFYAVDNRLIGILSYGDDLNDRAGGPWYSTNNQTLVTGWAAWTPASDSAGAVASGNSVTGLRVSGIYDSSGGRNLSFLRFNNTGISASTVDVTLANPNDGSLMATWTSPSIPPNATLQVDIRTIEDGAVGGTITKTGFYVASIRPHFNGYFQHVLWRPVEGNLSNITMCDTKLTNDPTRLLSVHTSTLQAGYPPSIVIQNTGASAATAVLGIYDALTGTKLGSYSTGAIPANAEVVRSIGQIETGIGYSPRADQFHYNVKLDTSFTGTLAYRMTNTLASDTLDMTAVCVLAAQ